MICHLKSWLTVRFECVNSTLSLSLDKSILAVEIVIMVVLTSLIPMLLGVPLTMIWNEEHLLQCVMVQLQYLLNTRMVTNASVILF